jgi:threonylcarbamoyladenosine tRNA methylthiotransferase MtaB
MPNQIDETVKTKRSEDLIQTGERLTRAYREDKIGTEVSALFEEEKVIGDKKYQVGHTKEYIEVAVETEEILSGKIETVLLKDFIDNEIMLATR